MEVKAGKVALHEQKQASDGGEDNNEVLTKATKDTPKKRKTPAKSQTPAKRRTPAKSQTPTSRRTPADEPEAATPTSLQTPLNLAQSEEFVQFEGIHASNAITFNLSWHYQMILYRLLGVAQLPRLTLGQVRLYARALYAPMQHHVWYHPDLPVGFIFGRGPLVSTPDGHQDHLANALSYFQSMALERGDILPNGRWNEVPHFIHLPLTEQDQRAMDLIDNPLSEGLEFWERDGLDAFDFL